ncbi:MAG: hypothetical protein R2825_23205 [Saprospiraceae bacterium]
MTVAYLNTKPQKANLKPLVKPMHFSQLKEELNYIQEEVAFYKKLLRLGIQNGTSRNKPTLYFLLDAFSKYEEKVIPELDHFIGVNEKAINLQNNMTALRQQLKDLKLQFFPLFSELQTFSIW